MKQEQIIDMFNNIAPTYDLANRLLSFGIDTRWRKRACQMALKELNKNPKLIVDVACGSGDMIFYWQEIAKKLNLDISKIIGIDPSSGMLEIAKKKLPQIEFIEAEAKSLPLEDNSVDIISISYGIRNVVERERAILDFFRVLKDNGMLVILEFTKSQEDNFLDKLSRFYLKKVLPSVGAIISGNYKAYKYLPDSIDSFLTQDMLCKELENVGFDIFFTKNYLLSTLFIAKKTLPKGQL